jgi:16S rRNA (guanine966-N2)-methyltransferase
VSRRAGAVRIVGGSRRGRRLKVPVGPNLRPTSEMVREAIFDALGPIGDLSVLDLFAGSGAMGLEALSRGAASCWFVEQDRPAGEVLRENISALGFSAVTRVLIADYQSALQALMRAGDTFDLLFVDPPYRMLPEVEVSLESVVPSLLRDGAVVVLEGDKATHPTLGAVPVFDRLYGDTRVTMVSVRRSIR